MSVTEKYISIFLAAAALAYLITMSLQAPLVLVLWLVVIAALVCYASDTDVSDLVLGMVIGAFLLLLIQRGAAS